jgi:hypothetical protein
MALSLRIDLRRGGARLWASAAAARAGSRLHPARNRASQNGNAIVISRPGGPEVLTIEELPEPEPGQPPPYGIR